MKSEAGLRQELEKLYLALEVIPQLVESNNTEPMKLSSHFINLKLLEDNGSIKNKEITFDQLFQEKEDSSLDQKKKETTVHILIKGGPGSGKSVLMDKIAFEWAKGEFPQYQHLFRINFRRLQTYASGIVLEFNKLVEFIKKEIVNNIVEQKQNQKQFVKKDFINNLEKQIQDCLFDQKNLSKIIILLDGFDEVASYVQTNQPQGQTLKGIAKEIQSYNVVITSRPNAVESVFLKSFKRIIQIQELQRKQMELFIDAYFGQAEGLKTMMKNILQDQEKLHLLNSPFLLTISCIMVAEDGEDHFNHSKGEIKESKLYQGIIKIIAKRYIKRSQNFNQKQWVEFQKPGYDFFSEVKSLKVIKETVAQLFYQRGQTTQISSISKQKFPKLDFADFEKVKEFGVFKKNHSQNRQSPRMQTQETIETLEFYHLSFGEFLIAVSVFEEFKNESKIKNLSKKYGSLEQLLTAVRYWPSSRNILKFVTELITNFYSNTPVGTEQRYLSIKVLKNFWTAMLNNSQNQVQYGKQEQFRLLLMLMKASRLSNNDNPEYYPQQIPCLSQIKKFMNQCIFVVRQFGQDDQINNWTTAFIVEAKYLSGQLTSKLVELIKKIKQKTGKTLINFLYYYSDILPELIYQKSNNFLADENNKKLAFTLYLQSQYSYLFPHRAIKLLQSLNDQQFQAGSIYIEKRLLAQQKEKIEFLRGHLFLINLIRKWYVDRSLKSEKQEHKVIHVYKVILDNIKKVQCKSQSEVNLCAQLLCQIKVQLKPFKNFQAISDIIQQVQSVQSAMIFVKQKETFNDELPTNKIQNYLKELSQEQIKTHLNDQKFKKFIQQVFDYPDEEQVKKSLKKYLHAFIGCKIYYFLMLKLCPCYQSMVEQNVKQVVENNCNWIRESNFTFSLEVFYNLFSKKESQLFFNQILNLGKQIIKTYIGLKYSQGNQFQRENEENEKKQLYFQKIVDYFQFSLIFKYDPEINQAQYNLKENVKSYSIIFNNQQISITKQLNHYLELMAFFRKKEGNQFRKDLSLNKTSYDTSIVRDLFVSTKELKLSMFEQIYFILLQSEKRESIWLEERRNQFGYVKVSKLLKNQEEVFLFWHPQLHSWKGVNSHDQHESQLQKKLRQFKKKVLGDRQKQLEDQWTVTVYQLKEEQKQSSIKSNPDILKKENPILTQTIKLWALMGYTQKSPQVIANKVNILGHIVQELGLQQQFNITQWLKGEPIQCQAYFYTLYWKLHNLVSGFGIASQGTVQRKEDTNRDQDSKKGIIKTISNLCSVHGQKIPLIGGAISFIGGFVKDIIGEQERAQFDNLIIFFKDLFQNTGNSLKQDLMIHQITQGLVKERKNVIVGKEKDPQEKQTLLKNVIHFLKQVKELYNSAKEIFYLPKKLTTTLESQQQTKNAVYLAVMDAGILFTALSQQKIEIFDKKLKREQIAPELIKTYLNFKAKKDEKIRQNNQKSCWKIICECLCCCISREPKEEKDQSHQYTYQQEEKKEGQNLRKSLLIQKDP